MQKKEGKHCHLCKPILPRNALTCDSNKNKDNDKKVRSVVVLRRGSLSCLLVTQKVHKNGVGLVQGARAK